MADATDTELRPESAVDLLGPVDLTAYADRLLDKADLGQLHALACLLITRREAAEDTARLESQRAEDLFVGTQRAAIREERLRQIVHSARTVLGEA